MAFFAVLVAGYFGIENPGYVAQVVAFAFGLAASSFFPILVLGIFSKRTTREGAICGMLAVEVMGRFIVASGTPAAIPILLPSTLIVILFVVSVIGIASGVFPAWPNDDRSISDRT